MAGLEPLNRWLERVLCIVLVLSGLGLVGTVTLQVVMRYVLKSSFLGVEEISTLFGLWIYFSGLAIVSARGQHIRGGFLSMMLSSPAMLRLERVFALLCAVICLYFFYLSLGYAGFILDVGRKSTFLRLPSLLWVASMVVGLLLSVLAFLAQAVAPVRRPLA